jgi:hypothetical protein
MADEDLFRIAEHSRLITVELFAGRVGTRRVQACASHRFNLRSILAMGPVNQSAAIRLLVLGPGFSAELS